MREKKAKEEKQSLEKDKQDLAKKVPLLISFVPVIPVFRIRICIGSAFDWLPGSRKCKISQT
jgi:hypothetical protein